jgi:cell division septation protein DedD
VYKRNIFVASAASLTLLTAACSSSSKTTTKPTTTSATTTTQPSISTTSPLGTIGPTVTVEPSSSTPASTTASNPGAADWEVVGGVFATEAAAKTQIDKLTAAKFPGFSVKKLTSTYAVVLPGMTKADATALAAKVTASGKATATIFEVVAGTTTPTTPTTPTTKPSTTPTTKAPTTTVSATATNYEVVAGIYTTDALAKAQIDKLTKATYTGFSVKPTGTKFAAVKAGLTNAEATALAKKISTAGLAAAYVKKL